VGPGFLTIRHRLVFSAVVCLACNAKAAQQQAPAMGQLEVRWNDSAHAAHFIVPAEARWCARDTLLEILAVRHDSAVGIALFVKDSLRAEALPVFRAELFAPWRPQATAAVRLVSPTGIRGFQSTWGQVEVTQRSNNRVSGTLDLHLKLAAAPDSLHVTGRFAGLEVRPAADWCGRASKPPTG
jgi:hypothetical protein